MSMLGVLMLLMLQAHTGAASWFGSRQVRPQSELNHTGAAADLTEARAAAEDAVSKVEGLRAEVQKSANYTHLSSEIVAKASEHAMAPYQERRAHIMSRMKDLNNATQMSRREVDYEWAVLRRALDDLERREQRVLDNRMRHMEASARHEARKDMERIDDLARKARTKIDVLLDQNSSLAAARKLEDRVDGAVRKAEILADDYALIVEKSVRAETEHPLHAGAALPTSLAALPVAPSGSVGAANAQPVSLAAQASTDQGSDSKSGAADGAVDLLKSFHSKLRHRSSNSDAISEWIDKAAVKAESPYIGMRNHLMHKLAELANVTHESRSRRIDELYKLRHEFDEVDHEQRRALRRSMDSVEVQARQQQREDEDRVDELARAAYRKIDHLVRGSRPAEGQARELEDRVDHIVHATQDMSEEFQRRVEDLARGHVDRLDYTEAAVHGKFNRQASLLERVAMTERVRKAASVGTASAFVGGAFCGLAATALVIFTRQALFLVADSRRPLLLS